jgi:hypothetical protein
MLDWTESKITQPLVKEEGLAAFFLKDLPRPNRELFA